MAPPQTAKVSNMVKFGGFVPQGWNSEPIQVKFNPWSTFAHQIWPWSVKGVSTGATNSKIWPNLNFLHSQGRQYIPVNLKYGMVEYAMCSLSRALFEPDQCQGWVREAPNIQTTITILRL